MRSLHLLAILALIAVPAAAPAETPSEPIGAAPAASPLDSIRDGGLYLVLNNPVGRELSHSCDVELCTTLLELINRAETSIDFAIYGIRGQPQIFNALIAAKERGVEVRGVVDRTLDGRNYYTDTDALARRLGTVRDDWEADQLTGSIDEEADELETSSDDTSRCWRERPDGFKGPKQCLGYDVGDHCIVSVHASREPLEFQGDIMHNKYFVIDNEWVWMGSTNTSDSGTGGYNANVVGVVHDERVAQKYTLEFTQMYGGHYHTYKQRYGSKDIELADGTTVRPFFSPQDTPMEEVISHIRHAEERIDIAVFFLTHKHVTRELIAAHRRGVQVRVIMDATAAKNGYAKHEIVRAAGIPLKIENWGGKMHAKAAAFDGKHLIIGSMNWTSAGQRSNDENTLVVTSPKHAQQFHEWFDTLWDAIPDTWLEGRPDPESRDSIGSCTDGVDNDFDHLDDDADPGCSDDPPAMPPMPPYSIVPKEDGYELIKGDVTFRGRFYYTPLSAGYRRTVIKPEKQDVWFCNEDDARAAGFQAIR